MMLKGRVWKDGRFWLIACPSLDAMTQGHTKREAFAMIVDWIKTALDQPDFQVEVLPDEGEAFFLRFADAKPILGLMIERARASSGMTLDEVAKKLGLKSRSNVKHYETGKHAASIAKAQEILDAMGFDLEISVRRRA